MTERQKRFADFFILYGNATKAAKEAGYSQKTSREIARKLLTKVDIKSYIDTEMKKKDSDTIASADEVLQFLTDVVRGKITDEVLTDVGIIEKKAHTKERVKAAELLGKRYQMFTEKIKISDDKDIYTREEIDEANKKMVKELEDD